MQYLSFATFLLAALRASASATSVASAYAAFRFQYRGASVADDVSFETRLAIFERSQAEVAAHNALPGVSWVAKLNRFADFTENELSAMRGYKRTGGRWSGVTALRPSFSSSFLETRESTIADTVDWRQKLNRSTSDGFIRNQGGCGSCWAVAAVGTLEMHAEIAGGHPEPLSYDQLVDCVSNPQHCGGSGGCGGATAELAYEYVKANGLLQGDSYTRADSSATEGPCLKPKSRSISLQNYVKLPVNELKPVLRTLTTKGPVVASVDASPWTFYGGGVFKDCSVNATVNHAVVLIGYGTDPEHGKYYLIRNSWGPEWGENGGYIRLQRHDSDKGEDGHCGVDSNPKEGVGCDGGPPTLPVCGMCGVLSDVSHPTGVSILESKESKQSE